MLTVGVDTYATLEEVNKYIQENYLSTDMLRIAWDSLSDEDREVYIRRAFQQINALPYTGRPSARNQVLSFPRCPWSPEDWTAVKLAQACQAFSLSDTNAQADMEQRKALQRAGVKSYRIGDLSETFGGIGSGTTASTLFGLSETSYNLLKKWLQGGYDVCGTHPHHRTRRKW